MTKAPLAVAALVALSGCGPSGQAQPPVGAAVEPDAPPVRPPEEATWAPDRADLVFMSNIEGNADIYLLSAGAADWQNLSAHPAQDTWPEWSPDGGRIAFQSNRAGNLDIWVMNADGSDPVQLTDDPADDYLPSWSLDGRQIAFASGRLEPGDDPDAMVHHYVMDADGSNERRLFAESAWTSAAVTWAPDNQGFVLAMKTPEGQGADIFQVDPAGAVLRRFTEDEPADGAPSFSADGSQLVFHADRGERSALVIMDADGTHRRTLLDDSQQWYPRWSPDGRWLVYTGADPAGTDDLDVLAIRADGSGAPIVLAGGPGREAEGRWRPSRPPDTR